MPVYGLTLPGNKRNTNWRYKMAYSMLNWQQYWQQYIEYIYEDKLFYIHHKCKLGIFVEHGQP